MSKFHEPVLLDDAIKGLNIRPNGVYIDLTFGGGGHSKEILKNLQDGYLIAFDQDQEALRNGKWNNDRFIMINKNFSDLNKELQRLKFCNVDGIIADLGVSSYQFSDNNRGFSLKYNSIIDMRMDKNLKKDGVFVVNKYSRQELGRIFKEHADFKNPTFIVDAIIKHRNKHSINTTFDLKNIFQNSIPEQFHNKFFARLFQSIRIEVNNEIHVLKSMLRQAQELLVPTGRLVVISYHSIEDKIVKSFMRCGNFLNSQEKDFFGNPITPFKLITKKPIVPTDMEIKLNNKARSAKLRICEKI
ncbi:MAG: 16S rRNA (cytosine(1402)-N(4))-methyltransferase [Flavobacteriales bacterium]|nr:16S rRNA (cytosine(1402)-N(4))-methyltransferase [Flavobacteriales bacterium]|tara:strand:- start:3781 stop:4683 length:903 start_codon:yes stop_codon:yes gene_type:complete